MLKYILVAYFCISSAILEGGSATEPKTYECGNVKVEIPENRMGIFKYQIIGQDYENTPVVLIHYGIWDMDWISGQPKEKEIFKRNYYNWIDEIINGTLNDQLKLDFWKSDDIAFIVDFNNFKYNQLVSPRGMAFGLETLARLQQLSPRLTYIIYLNANPLVYQLTDLAKPLIPNLLEKSEMYGTNDKRWKPQLLKKIPRNQLPPYLGGDEDFKPIVECDIL